MEGCRGWLIGVAVVLACSLVAADGRAQHTPTHRLVAAIGVPVPLSVHGRYPEPSDTSVKFVGHGVVAYDAGPIRGAHWIRFGGQFAAVHMAGTVGDADGRVTFLTLNPTVGVYGAPIPGLDVLYGGVGGGPGILRNVVYVDENLNKRTHSFGVRGFASLTWQPAERFGVTARMALDVYKEPFDEPTWYNQPLGDTNFISYDLGVSYSW
jgi:hypothetical protein